MGPSDQREQVQPPAARIQAHPATVRQGNTFYRKWDRKALTPEPADGKEPKARRLRAFAFSRIAPRLHGHLAETVCGRQPVARLLPGRRPLWPPVGRSARNFRRQLEENSDSHACCTKKIHSDVGRFAAVSESPRHATTKNGCLSQVFHRFSRQRSLA